MSDIARVLGAFQRLYEAMDELDQNLADGTDDDPHEGGEHDSLDESG